MTRLPSDFSAKVVFNPELSGDALDLSASSGATSAMFSLWLVSRNGNPPRPVCTSYEMGRMVWHHIHKEGRQHRGDKQLRRHPRNGMVGLFGSLAELSAMSRDVSCSHAQNAQIGLVQRFRRASMDHDSPSRQLRRESPCSYWDKICGCLCSPPETSEAQARMKLLL